MQLEGKGVLVTGGTSGIGRATVIECVRNGSKVVFSGRNDNRGKELEAELNTDTNSVLFVKTNVREQQDVDNLFSKTINFLGRIDGAFNNAGIDGEVSPFSSSTRENWDNVIDTNLNGTWNCMKEEIDHMLECGGGNIVNMASTSGLVGNGFGLSAYAASKFAIVGLTKSVALEYAKKNIRVNCICPGFVETPMIESIIDKQPSMRRRFVACHPMGRLGTPNEIAKAVVYMLSENSSFMTGHSMVLDGGLTI